MWIIFFMLLGVFVVAVMGVAFWSLMKEPRTEELTEGKSASQPQDAHQVAEIEGAGGEQTEKGVASVS